MRTPKVVSSGRRDSYMRTVSFGPSTRKLPVPADTAFSKISMLRNGIIVNAPTHVPTNRFQNLI